MTQLISLSQMNATVRRMTARYTTQQMPDTQINYYINLAYTIFMPLEFKNLKLTKPYVFTTVPNVDTYDFIYEDNPTNPDTGGQTLASPGNIMITPPVYCQGYAIRFYQEKTYFYNRWPKLSVNQIIGQGGNPGGTAYTGTIPTTTPFLRAQLDIFGNVTEPAVYISAFDGNIQPSTAFNYVITDVPNPNSNIGDLYDSQGNDVGTINYITGDYNFTPFNSAVIPSSCTIYAAVIPYQASRPTDVLFFNQQFVLRPVPLEVYQVEMQISQQPTQLIAENSAPELNEWYLFICAYAAKLIYDDFPDPEGMEYLKPTLDEQISMAQRRTLKQLSTQRASTIFSQPSRPLANYFYGQEYSGN